MLHRRNVFKFDFMLILWDKDSLLERKSKEKFEKYKKYCTALSFDRPLSLWLLSESKYRRVRLVAL